MYSEALRARDWNDRKIGNLISPELEQPMIHSYLDTVSEIKTDPLVSFALPMEIDNFQLDAIVMGLRKVSEVANILYDFYKGPEATPAMGKLVREVRDVMNLDIQIG